MMMDRCNSIFKWHHQLSPTITALCNCILTDSINPRKSKTCFPISWCWLCGLLPGLQTIICDMSSCTGCCLNGRRWYLQNAVNTIHIECTSALITNRVRPAWSPPPPLPVERPAWSTDLRCFYQLGLHLLRVFCAHLPAKCTLQYVQH